MMTHANHVTVVMYPEFISFSYISPAQIELFIIEPNHEVVESRQGLTLITRANEDRALQRQVRSGAVKEEPLSLQDEAYATRLTTSLHN